MKRYVNTIVKLPVRFAALLMLLSACAPAQTELAGTYNSDDPNLMKKGWKSVFEGYNGFITGTELELKTDSTFLMVTCANILTGTWSQSDDSLFLTYQTNRWKNDSLQEFGLDGKWPKLVKGSTEALVIKGNQLIISPQEDGYKSYNVLEK